MSVYEFTVYVQFAADDWYEARDQLDGWLNRPDPDCYAIGVQSHEPREVAEDDH